MWHTKEPDYQTWPPYLFLSVEPAVHLWVIGTQRWSRGLPLELSGPATHVPGQAPVSVTSSALHRISKRRKCGVMVRLQCRWSQQHNYCSTAAASKGTNLHLFKICRITPNLEYPYSRCLRWLNGSLTVWWYRLCVLKVVSLVLDLCHTAWTCMSHSIPQPNITFPHSR